MDQLAADSGRLRKQLEHNIEWSKAKRFKQRERVHSMQLLYKEAIQSDCYLETRAKKLLGIGGQSFGKIWS